MAREASVLAYNDVFALLARLAGGTAILVALSLFFNRFFNHFRHFSPKATS
jgi:hypothetical protein